MTARLALIALGGNLASPLGSPSQSVKLAFEQLAQETPENIGESRLYCTPAYPAGAGPDYINAAASFPWADTAEALLALLHRIEARFARDRKDRWQSRTLDLDLLALGGKLAPSGDVVRHWIDLPLADQLRHAPGELILPHPRIQDRAFVLGPLRDVAPDWCHPILGRTVAQMWADLPEADRDAITVLAPG